MDLINPDNELNLYNDDWKIYSNVKSKVPQFIGDNAEVKNSIISEGAIILGKVENSVIFPGVYVAEDAVVKNSVVMEDCRILSNCQIDKAIVGTKAVINGDNYIGDGEEVLLIENDINIKAGEYKKAE